MKRIALLLVCLSAMTSGVQADQMFRWVDKDGKMNYGDTPPANSTDVERIKFSGQSTQNDDLPYETRRAQENFPVTLYVGSGCGETCEQARGLLNKRGIPFSEKVLKTKADVEAFKALSGIEGVPVLAVGKNYLRGFLAQQWQSELDIAGYPKTASYSQRIASPAPAEPKEAPTPDTPETPPVQEDTETAEPASQ